MRNRFQTDNPRPHLLRRALSSVAVTGCGIALLLAGTQGKEADGSKPDNKNEKHGRTVLQKGADSKDCAGDTCQLDTELVKYFTEDRHDLCHEHKQNAKQHGKQDERIRQCITDAAGEAVLTAVIAAKSIHDILQRAGAFTDLCHFYKIFRKDAAGAKCFSKITGLLQCFIDGAKNFAGLL